MNALHKKWVAVCAATVATVAIGNVEAAELRLGTVTPPGQTWTVNAEKMAAEFNERSEKDKITVFPSAQLGNEADMFQQLQSGVLALSFMTVSEIANRVPEMNALLAPFVATSNAEAARLLTESQTANRLLELLPERTGVIGLGYGMAGVTQVMTVDPAKGPEDLKGKKIRITPSPAIRDWDQILGAAPIPLALPALYDATVNGQVDALELNLEVMNLGKYDDITSSLLVTHQSMFPMVVLVSEATWLSMDEGSRALLSEVARKYAGKILEETVAAEDKALAALKARGKVDVVMLDATPYSDAIAQWDKAWVDRAPDIPTIREEAENLR